MVKYVLKVVCGIVLGVLLYTVFRAEQIFTGSEWLLCIAWGIGIVGGWRQYLSWLSGAFNTSFKIGVLSWLAGGSSIIGIVFFVLILAFVLLFGWVYGWVLLIKEWIAAL